MAAVQHGRGADVQLALPAPPLDTFETLGEPIKSEYTNDARFQDVGFIEKHGLAKEGDFWYKNEQIAVPESSGLIGRCMHMLHNPAYCGHLGGNRTYQAVKQFFWWNGMKDDVLHFHCKGIASQEVNDLMKVFLSCSRNN